jgi:hypothetical protein
MNDAAQRNDPFDFKNAEHAQLVSDILMFDEAGKLSDLVDMVNSQANLSDKDLQELVQATTTKLPDGRTSGPFVDDNGNSMADTE